MVEERVENDDVEVLMVLWKGWATFVGVEEVEMMEWVGRRWVEMGEWLCEVW